MLKKLDVRFFKYVISGGTAAIVEFVAFSILIWSLASNEYRTIISQTLSFGLGLLVSYTLNRIWVFESKTDKTKQFASYFTLAIINLLIGNFAIWILVDHLGLLPYVAKVIVMAMIVLWNYLIYQKVIFKPNL